MFIMNSNASLSLPVNTCACVCVQKHMLFFLIKSHCQLDIMKQITYREGCAFLSISTIQLGRKENEKLRAEKLNLIKVFVDGIAHKRFNTTTQRI